MPFKCLKIRIIGNKRLFSLRLINDAAELLIDRSGTHNHRLYPILNAKLGDGINGFRLTENSGSALTIVFMGVDHGIQIAAPFLFKSLGHRLSGHLRQNV